MKTIKVSEATELQLDWLVAKCVNPAHGMVRTHQDNKDQWHVTLHGERGNYAPSTDWAVGGPIIEREVDTIERRVGYFYVNRFKRHKDRVNPDFSTTPGDRNAWATGPTMLIAGLRCYVASKFGDTAEVPEELA